MTVGGGHAEVPGGGGTHRRREPHEEDDVGTVLVLSPALLQVPLHRRQSEARRADSQVTSGATTAQSLHVIRPMPMTQFLSHKSKIAIPLNKHSWRAQRTTFSPYPVN